MPGVTGAGSLIWSVGWHYDHAGTNNTKKRIDMMTNVAWSILPLLFLILIYVGTIALAIYLVIRFIRAHERIASALEDAARKAKSDGK
jgi:hypothetical protein